MKFNGHRQERHGGGGYRVWGRGEGLGAKGLAMRWGSCAAASDPGFQKGGGVLKKHHNQSQITGAFRAKKKKSLPPDVIL